MALDGRLRIKQEWGTFAKTFFWHLTSNRSFIDAMARGDVRGVQQYRLKGGPADPVEEDDIDIATHPLGSEHRRIFGVEFNSKDAWADQLHGGNYLREFAKHFMNNVWTLGHVSSDPALYSCEGLIEADTPHTLRFLLADVGNDEEVAEWFAVDWGGDSAKWMFLLSTHATALMQRAATWDADDEAEFFTLLAVKEPTAEQQQDLLELRSTLYVDYTELSLRGDKVENKGTFYEVTFFPDRSGRVGVYERDVFVAELKCTRILQPRVYGNYVQGQLWGASRLTVQRSAGHFFWQVGWPIFPETTTVDYPYQIAAADSPIEFLYLRSFETGETSVVAQDIAINSVWATLRITFTSTNPRKTAWLYACFAFAAGGERNGSPEVQLDTNPDAYSPATAYPAKAIVKFGGNIWKSKVSTTGNEPAVGANWELLGADPGRVIRDGKPQCEGEFRRVQYTVTAGDVDGKTFKNFPLYGTGEHRCVDWDVNDTRVITDGIIVQATSDNMRAATPNQPRVTIAKGESEAELIICDKTVLLEEYELRQGEFIGDGLYLEDVLIWSLRAIGEKEENLTRITYKSLRPLPAAIPGEKWCIEAQGGQSLLEFNAKLWKRYGYGLTFSCARDGKWDVYWPTTAIKTLGGYPAHFVSGPTPINQDSSTYPGRLRILENISMPRDVADFYNRVTVEGAKDINGDPLVWTEDVEESIHLGTASRRDQRYIGRVRTHPVICDESLRTLDDVVWCTRSTLERVSQPPRLYGGITFFHEGLSIGDPVNWDGVPIRLIKTPGGSMANDRMTVLGREIYVPGGNGA